MYVARVPNRNSPPAILLRESYREGNKVRTRTVANLSHWPEDKVERLRRVLRDEPLVPLCDSFEIVRTRPHGHVAAVLGTLRKVGLHRYLDREDSRMRRLAMAMIVARVISPRSKLATGRGLRSETLASTLGELLDVADADEDELYEALDWLVARQDRIENSLAKQHLKDGCLVLYDVTSTYFEGRTCSLARFGLSRDGKRSTLQIVFGLLCNAEGCPVAVEVFEGNTNDAKTLTAQVEKVCARFALNRVVFVGDRGMITEARIRENLWGLEGVGWITALRAPAIQKLRAEGALQLSLFDERDLAEIRSERYPDERLVACRNPLLAADRARTRTELLDATERALNKVVDAVSRTQRPLRGKGNIGIRIGKVLGRYKVGKHFLVDITDDSLSYRRNTESIEAEAALDGFYVLRTNVAADEMDADSVVAAYKGLSRVERAFRSLKTVDLHVRPIYHRLPSRVRAHVLLCMLAYYVEWHMRRALAPILFDDDDTETARRLRKSVVAKAEVSPAARRKAATKRTAADEPVHSFRTVLEDLATIAVNRIRPPGGEIPEFDRTTTPTPFQTKILDILGTSLQT